MNLKEIVNISGFFTMLLGIWLEKIIHSPVPYNIEELTFSEIIFSDMDNLRNDRNNLLVINFSCSKSVKICLSF
jgi:hypothetical protein